MTSQPPEWTDGSSASSGSSPSDPGMADGTTPAPESPAAGAAPGDPGRQSWQQPPGQGQHAYGRPAYGQQPPPAGPYPGVGQHQPPQPPYGQPGSQPQPYPGPTPLGGPPLSASDERLWSTLSHISIPFLGVIGPLIVFLVFKDRGQFVHDNAVESLNFSILYTIAQFVCSILAAVVIGAVLLPIVFIVALILCIVAAVAANKGDLYRYPFNWRLVK